MMWDRELYAFIPRNPILLRDLRHQQRTTSFLRGNLESVGVVALALCFSVAMLSQVVNRLIPWPDYAYLEPVQLLAWIFHTAAAVRLLAAGVWIAAKDGYLLGSDDLMLTPLSNWQLFSAKWWAALHQVRGWMLALGIVQIGIVVSTGFGLLMTVDWGKVCTGGSCVVTVYGLYRPLWFAPIWFTATRTTFIIASAIGIAILETVCCTALGMAFAMLVRSKLGFVCAISLRFAPVLIFSAFPDYPWAFSNNLLSRYTEYTWFSFADGGTGALVQMANPDQMYGVGFERGVLGLCAVLGMLLLYLGMSLLTARVVMRRSRH